MKMSRHLREEGKSLASSKVHFKDINVHKKKPTFAGVTNPNLSVYPYLGCLSVSFKNMKGCAIQSKKFCYTKISTFGELIIPQASAANITNMIKKRISSDT